MPTMKLVMGSREENGVDFFSARNQESLKLCAEGMKEVVQIISSSLEDILMCVTAALKLQ